MTKTEPAKDSNRPRRNPESGSAAAEDPTEIVRRKPIPGKGHRKSRRGCYNCKRRRVKCPGGRPECQHCGRMGLSCAYPPPLITHGALPPTPKSNLDLDHLRFFHHFLVAAHPPLPYGASEVWHNVATLAYKYEFLANAALALAAQHLTLFTKSDYTIQALDLRIAAINGLNEALSRPCDTLADADARYAAIIALTYQSSYMADAMMEFLAMMRGWMLISTNLVLDPENSLFKSFTRDSFVASMSMHVSDAAQTHKNTAMIGNFCASLRIVAPLCQSVAELKYLSMMEGIAHKIKTSPLDACLEIVPCYAMTNKMTAGEFVTFTDPQNYTAQVLLAHFFMLDYVLEMHTLGPTDRPFAFRKQVTRSWVVKAAERLPTAYQKYMLWPLGLAREAMVA